MRSNLKVDAGVAAPVYDTILVPTDGSDAAAGAAAEAFDLARSLGATVHLVYVVDESATSFLLSGDTMSAVLEKLTEEGDAVVDEAAAGAGDVETVTEVIRGVGVHEAIVEYVEREGVDLVVMGTRGRHGVDHLLGSTTERVLGRIDVPVLVVSG